MALFAVVILILAGICWCIGRVRLMWRWAVIRGHASTLKNRSEEYTRGYLWASSFDRNKPGRLQSMLDRVNAIRAHGTLREFDIAVEDYVKTEMKIKRLSEAKQ